VVTVGLDQRKKMSGQVSTATLADSICIGIVLKFNPALRPTQHCRPSAGRCNEYRWRRGAVGRVSDSRSRGRGFESRPGTRRKNSGHVSHTYVPLFTKQYKLVPAKGR